MNSHSAVPEGTLEQALRQVAKQRGDFYAASIHAILQTNLERGRLQSFLRTDAIASICDYVRHVVQVYDALHEYVYQIQVEKSSRVWRPLLEKLRAWAYSYLGRWELAVHARTERAWEFADVAGVEIVRSHFPFDIEFDRWAYVLLRNACCGNMRRINSSASAAVVERMGWTELDECICEDPSDNGDDLEHRVADRIDLLAAIEQMSEKRQHVIMMHYFEGKCFSEIANNTGVRTSTLHKRHFDALAQLRTLLD